MDRNKISELFSSERGERIYGHFLRAVEDNAMRPLIDAGVIVGLSGGADSVMLALILLEYKRREGLGSRLLFAHLNHGIRGEEALRDELFARRFSESVGVEFVSTCFNVPSVARETGKSVEEAARDVRYSWFRDIIIGRGDVSSIALGHNATDNLETVIFNIMRGSGSRGVAGIPPVRDNIFRPLIYVSKRDIEEALVSSGVEFVTDSTNFSTLYMRNYIRHEIIPHLSKLTASPEVSVTRLTQNIRVDNDYIDSVAEDFLRSSSGNPSAESLAALHEAVFSRVVSSMAKSVSGVFPERVHIKKIRELLSGGNFRYSLPGGCEFVGSYGVCRIMPRIERKEGMYICLSEGKNELPEYSATVELLSENTKTSYNVYKFSIQANLSSAIIKGGLYIRSRREGDGYFYGGMTHKLKKMFIDRKIPSEYRSRVPVLCDDSGILWVAGFGVRDDGVRGEPRRVRISFDDYNKSNGFYIPKAITTDKKKGAVDT